MTRAVGFIAALFVAVAGLAGTAEAGITQSVRISATTPMAVHEQCFTEPTTTPGSFTFERNSTFGALDITYHISGGPTDLNSDEAAGEDHTASFADGAATVTVTVNPAITAGASATVEVLDGQTYNLGDPSEATIEIARSTPQCAEETTTTVPEVSPSTLARTGARSTSGPLALTGVGMITLGALLLVAASRRKAAV